MSDHLTTGQLLLQILPAWHRERLAGYRHSWPLVLAMLLLVLWSVRFEAHAQSTPPPPASTPEKMMRALPADPASWQPHLNHFGQQGWDVLSIQPVSSGGLTLYIVTYQRTTTTTPMLYAVLLSEFSRDATPDSLVSARTQLEIQTNEHGQAGWHYLLSVSGQRSADELFLSLVFKKAAP